MRDWIRCINSSLTTQLFLSQDLLAPFLQCSNFRQACLYTALHTVFILYTIVVTRHKHQERGKAFIPPLCHTIPHFAWAIQYLPLTVVQKPEDSFLVKLSTKYCSSVIKRPHLEKESYPSTSYLIIFVFITKYPPLLVCFLFFPE